MRKEGPLIATNVIFFVQSYIEVCLYGVGGGGRAMRWRRTSGQLGVVVGHAAGDGGGAGGAVGVTGGG